MAQANRPVFNTPSFPTPPADPSKLSEWIATVLLPAIQYQMGAHQHIFPDASTLEVGLKQYTEATKPTPVQAGSGRVIYSSDGANKFQGSDGSSWLGLDGGGGAPVDAEYLVGALHGGLSAERLVTDTATVSWDLGTPGQAKANVVTGGLRGTPVNTYATTEAPGAASTFIATDATLQFPQGLMAASGGTDPMTMTQSATDVVLTFSNAGGKTFEAGGTVQAFAFTNAGGTSSSIISVAASPTLITSPFALITASWSGGTLASKTIRCWDARYNSGSMGVTDSTIIGFGMSAFSFAPNSGSNSNNIVYGAQLTGPVTTFPSWNNAFGMTEMATLYAQGARRGSGSWDGAITLGAGIIVEPPTIGGTVQYGILVRQLTAQKEATNRIGLQIDVQNSGTNRKGGYFGNWVEIENPSGRTDNVLQLDQLNTGAAGGAHILFNDKAGDPTGLVAGQLWRNATKVKFYEGTLTHDLNPLTTKGDIIVHNGTTEIRLPVGTDGQQLTADSTQASGLKWDAAGGAGAGDNITVNGVAVTDADFDDATPAPTSGDLPVLWAISGSGPTDIRGEVGRISSRRVFFFNDVASAVNHLRSTNAITGVAPSLSATGSDSNIHLGLSGKGTGYVKASASDYASSMVLTASSMMNYCFVGAMHG